MNWFIVALLVGVGLMEGVIAVKLRAWFVHLEKRLAGFERNFERMLQNKAKRVEGEVAESSVEVQTAISLGALEFKFPVFLNDASIDSFHARRLISELVARNPKTILELGSGSSSTVIARAMQLMGPQEYIHISIDHDKDFLTLSERLAQLNGVDGGVVFCHCPLGEVGDSGFVWYTGVPELVGDRTIDLLVIDGPPAYEEADRSARYPALPTVHRLLSANCAIILDDANRAGERETIERWRSEYPEFSVTIDERGKGVAVLYR